MFYIRKSLQRNVKDEIQGGGNEKIEEEVNYVYVREYKQKNEGKFH